MKKQLLSTTTLVAAGLLAFGGAVDANAAEPLKVKVGGFYSAAVIYWDQENATNLRSHGIEETGELQISASSTLDNGLKVSVRIEYEALNQGATTLADENHVTFDGGFGRLRLGQDDNGAYGLHIQAPVAAWRVGINSPSFAVLSGNGNAVSSFVSTYPGIGGDGDKIIYFTPRVSGFQLGTSYQPDGANLGGPSAAGTSEVTANQQSEVVSLGASYSGSFDAVDLSASIAYVAGSIEAPTAGNEDREALAFGLTVGFGDFAIGAAYKNDDRGLVGNFDRDTIDIGATYSTGPWTVGVNYGHEEVELGAGVADDELDAFAFTGQYVMGPGVKMIGAIKHYSYDSATAGQSPSGLVLVLATDVSF